LTDTELRDIDPNFYLSILHERYNQLPATTQTALQQMNCQKSSPPDAQDFTKEFEEFLVKFGHLSDSGNDFSKVPWREMPELVFKMIVDFDRSEVVPSDKFDVKDLKISPIKGIFLNYMYDHTVMHRQYKERTSFLYTYGYGLFRPYFLHLGTLLWKNGFIQSAQDIFYLTFDEINDILTRSTTSQDDKIKIENRKQEITKYHDVLLPDIIYGDLPPLLLDTAVERKLTGIPASKGYYEGPVVVARGIEDFKTIKEGVVLVIPYSDVGWSPLFAKAKAIISESGGILSHAAIVAREYDIPAVVSVQGALELTNNTIVGVDGNKGEVLVKQ
jgi:phosphoenolpyruvate synthase/pyruvate phosphate dikinase